MTQSISSLLCLLIIVACSSPTNNSKTSKTETSEKETTIIKSNPLKLDTFQIADSLVKEIKLSIKANRLIKKSENQMDPEGGSVYGYFNSDKQIEYLYSSFGSEFGKDETVTYYKNNKIIYAEYRFYWCYRDKNGTIVNKKIVAEKTFYFPDSTISKDTITIYNHNLKAPYPSIEFKKSKIPTAKQFVAKTIKMLNNLLKHSE